MSKIWFITGAGRGFGREFTRAALERGDQVAATARNTDALADLYDDYGASQQLLPIALDVTDRTAVEAAVAEAVDYFGRLDVVINNAGYGLFGMVEEITPEQLRDQLDVNLFGVLHVTQTVVPVMREQGSGHIVQISTIGGIAAFPGLGGYHASKWALEGMSESLAQEVAPFGIKVTIVEPGGYATDWAGNSATHATPLAAYDGHRAAAKDRPAPPPTFIGNPAGVGPAMLDIVDADQPPLRVMFGLAPTQMIPPIYQARLNTWEQWEDLSIRANGH
jgi:NAD(P)-dependent dehydrogenase (short-subunit alcohol dehydrogenase family)